MNMNVDVRMAVPTPPKEYVITLTLSEQETRMLRAALGNVAAPTFRQAVATASVEPPAGQSQVSVQIEASALVVSIANKLQDALRR